MSSSIMSRFWSWYERHYNLHLAVTTILFTWQLAHLFWLTTHVVSLRVFNVSFFPDIGFLQFLLVIADYFEVPALIGATLLYLNTLIKKPNWKDVSFLILVNSQWLHLFWITDEFVVDMFTGNATASVLPFWLAWVAIGIDYLELPVIYDTVKRSVVVLRDKYFLFK